MLPSLSCLWQRLCPMWSTVAQQQQGVGSCACQWVRPSTAYSNAVSDDVRGAGWLFKELEDLCYAGLLERRSCLTASSQMLLPCSTHAHCKKSFKASTFTALTENVLLPQLSAGHLCYVRIQTAAAFHEHMYSASSSLLGIKLPYETLCFEHAASQPSTVLQAAGEVRWRKGFGSSWSALNQPQTMIRCHSCTFMSYQGRSSFQRRDRRRRPHNSSSCFPRHFMP
jgi:hypothetical protein